ncbi:MAG: acyl-CoA desaturase [bacterium]|nr:acyl-CoA desaturase [bacterium]MDZ4285329.1 acyl-CoA desaturase [Candidatus Sungbacteria bacterium]
MENPNRLFSELDARIRASGLLNWSPYFYIFSMTVIAALIAVSFFILAYVHSFWLQLANALLLAFSFGQLGFFLHDVGHGQVVGSRWHRWMGIVFSLILGWSLSWWINKHNRHHAFPNQAGKDPDIDFGPLAFSKEQADQKKGIMRAIVRHQASLFVPMLMLEAWNLRVASIGFLLRSRMREKYLLLLFIILHVVLYGWLLLTFLPAGWAIAFAAVHWSALGIYLGLSFAPNHKGMPIVQPGSLKGFLEQQLHTTRNMRGGVVIDMLTGGLNYQIEHHLWPSMQRRSLKRAAVIVEEFCRMHGLSYHAVGVGESYGEIFGNFSKVSASMK